ncbi:hypothetical protein ACA910_007708 [Epithemia clementina (nom. ined.)]
MVWSSATFPPRNVMKIGENGVRRDSIHRAFVAFVSALYENTVTQTLLSMHRGLDSRLYASQADRAFEIFHSRVLFLPSYSAILVQSPLQPPLVISITLAALRAGVSLVTMTNNVVLPFTLMCAVISFQSFQRSTTVHEVAT